MYAHLHQQPHLLRAEVPGRQSLVVLPLSVLGSREMQGNNMLKIGAQSSRACLSGLTLLTNGNGF